MQQVYYIGKKKKKKKKTHFSGICNALPPGVIFIPNVNQKTLLSFIQYALHIQSCAHFKLHQRIRQHVMSQRIGPRRSYFIPPFVYLTMNIVLHFSVIHLLKLASLPSFRPYVKLSIILNTSHQSTTIFVMVPCVYWLHFEPYLFYPLTTSKINSHSYVLQHIYKLHSALHNQHNKETHFSS